MKNNKGKKNYKLRRRVKRTVASLTMVMAVVVAAIPVENYGTMQASGVSGVDLREKADKYLLVNGSLNSDLKKYDAEQYEKEYDKSNVKIVQHIEGESFIDAYEVWLGNRNRAMIARSVFAKDRDRFDIYETEYYDYVQMDDAYITAVNTAFASEEYKLEYNTSSVPYTSKNVNVTVPGDTSGATTPGTLDGVTVITISTDSPKASVSHSGTNGAITDNVDYDDERDVNTYTKNRQITLDSEVEDILTNYAPSSLETYLDRINAYNREVGTYKEVFDRCR